MKRTDTTITTSAWLKAVHSATPPCRVCGEPVNTRAYPGDYINLRGKKAIGRRISTNVAHIRCCR